jgi:hypothetical protein
MTNWVPITYRGYWDVPRIILARAGRSVFLLECLFDDDLDDYPDEYQVYLMPADLDERSLPQDWGTLRGLAVRRLGVIPVGSVRFDTVAYPRHLDAAALDPLTAANLPSA